METSFNSQAISLNPFNQKVKEGISVFTAIKNRREMLEKSLPTWLANEQINEIIILDWSSEDDLSSFISSIGSEKILLAKVFDQPKWVLSLACNLAARLTSYNKILKLDADIQIEETFFREHVLEPGWFYTGNWRTARNDNEKHLHGVSFLFRSDFFKVNGYNEIIKTYGWDDIDLYERLENTGLIHKYLNQDTLRHLEHSHRTNLQDRMGFLRTGDDKEKALLNSLINRFVIESTPKWTIKNTTLRFRIKPESSKLLHCFQDSEDCNIIPEELIKNCESKAIVERFYELGIKIPAYQLKLLNHDELISLINLYYERNLNPEKSSLFKAYLKFGSALPEKPAENVITLPETDSARQFHLENQVEEILNSWSWKIGKGITSGLGFFLKAVKPEQSKNWSSLPPNARKFNLGEEVGAFYGQHRSGWGFAIASLAPLHNPSGIVLDSFIERTFQWHPRGTRPHKEPWIGFIHVPPGSPAWFAPEVSNQTIFNSETWKESLPFCKGLFTLSDYHKRHLEKLFGFQINNLYHPTEQPIIKWNWERFIANKNKKVIQVGFWLRKLYAIYALQTPSDFRKVFIRKENVNLDYLMEQERKFSEYKERLTPENLSSVETIGFLSDHEYDRLLSENIVFIDLYDASANNSVIECIVRNTPILVNPIEPVVEYLGEKYPFYFHNLEEANRKIKDLSLIKSTHQYLVKHSFKNRLTSEWFLKSVINSPIYKSL